MAKFTGINNRSMSKEKFEALLKGFTDEMMRYFEDGRNFTIVEIPKVIVKATYSPDDLIDFEMYWKFRCSEKIGDKGGIGKDM